MNTSLDTLFDLSLARTQLARDVDHPLSAHGISLADLAILRELRREPAQKLRRSELAQRLGITPSGIARQVAPLPLRPLARRVTIALMDQPLRVALGMPEQPAWFVTAVRRGLRCRGLRCRGG